MTSKKNIFDRLSLKKKINLNRQNKISEQLSNESEKNANLIEQIKDLQSHQNMKRAKTKAAEKRKKEVSLLETKKELMTPKINKL